MVKRVGIILLMLCLLMVMNQPLFAADSSATSGIEGLTIEQAIERALSHSQAVQQADYDVERSEQVRDALYNSVYYTPQGPTPTEISEAFSAMSSSDISYRMAKKTKSVEEDKVVLSTYNAYTDVLTAIENRDYANKALAQARLLANISNISYEQGIITKYDRDTVQVQLNSAQNSFSDAEREVDSAYLSFNQLLGFNSDERATLVEYPSFSPLSDEDLQVRITRALNESPALWLAEQYADLAAKKLDMYDFTDSSLEPYGTKEIDLYKAELSAENAQDQVRLLMELTYHNILTLENSYQLQQEAIRMAQEDLQIQKLKFEVGMATKTEVQAAEIALLEKQIQLNQIVYQHDSAKYMFEKPWTAS